MEETGDTQTVPSGGSTDDEELPEPGAGVPGDEGICQGSSGGLGYVSLSLLAIDGNGNPAEAVSAATDEVMDEVESGTDLYSAIGGLGQPVTDFANACTAAGVTI